jgi:DNA repair protein RadC
MMMRESEVIYRPRPDLPAVDGRKQITVAADVAAIVLAALQGKTRETFMLLALDTKHRVTGDIELRTGTLDASLVHPRDVFGWAVAVQASALVLAHNHPSGDD